MFEVKDKSEWICELIWELSEQDELNLDALIDEKKILMMQLMLSIVRMCYIFDVYLIWNRLDIYTAHKREEEDDRVCSKRCHDLLRKMLVKVWERYDVNMIKNR